LSKKIETVVDRIANVGNMKPNECNGPGRSERVPKGKNWLKRVTKGKKINLTDAGKEREEAVTRKTRMRKMGEEERETGSRRGA
jgi:hypothetical protein